MIIIIYNQYILNSHCPLYSDKLTLLNHSHFTGKSYFFKGKGYWQFDDDHMRVAHNQTLPSAQRWMKCPPTHPDREDAADGDEEDYYGDENEATNEASHGERPTQRSSLVSAGGRTTCRLTGSVMMAVLSMWLLWS